MIQSVAFTVFWLATAVAILAAWKTIRNTRVNDAMFYAVSAVEIGAIVLFIAGIIGLIRSDRDVEGTLLVSYLVTLVLVPPVALVWSVAEKSRWGTGVLLVAMWTVAILSIRTLQVWHG